MHNSMTASIQLEHTTTKSIHTPSPMMIMTEFSALRYFISNIQDSYWLNFVMMAISGIVLRLITFLVMYLISRNQGTDLIPKNRGKKRRREKKSQRTKNDKKTKKEKKRKEKVENKENMDNQNNNETQEAKEDIKDNRDNKEIKSEILEYNSIQVLVT